MSDGKHYQHTDRDGDTLTLERGRERGHALVVVEHQTHDVALRYGVYLDASELLRLAIACVSAAEAISKEHP